jgi:hypothetical protein
MIFFNKFQDLIIAQPLNEIFLATLFLFLFNISLELQHIKNGWDVIKSRIFLKNIIFHIKLFHHFEFSRKRFSIKVLFLPKINKNKRKMDKNIIFHSMGEKYKHFRRHLEYSRLFNFSRRAKN